MGSQPSDGPRPDQLRGTSGAFGVSKHFSPSFQRPPPPTWHRGARLEGRRAGNVVKVRQGHVRSWGASGCLEWGMNREKIQIERAMGKACGNV